MTQHTNFSERLDDLQQRVAAAKSAVRAAAAESEAQLTQRIHRAQAELDQSVQNAQHEVSKAGDRYDGWLLVKQGNERGYRAGEEPKAKAKEKAPAKAKTETPPASDDEKAEKTAAGKLELARSLLKDGKKDHTDTWVDHVTYQAGKC